MAKARKPTSLEQLADLLRANTKWNGVRIAHGEIDWTSLPTFGGDEPADTAEVWSWDAGRLLVGTCADDLRIVTRAEWAGVIADLRHGYALLDSIEEEKRALEREAGLRR